MTQPCTRNRSPGASLHAYLATALIITLLTALLAACLPCPPQATMTTAPLLAESRPWTYADLRLVDPIDAPSPQQELVAAYLRRGVPAQAAAWELRLDFLQVSLERTSDIYILLDYTQGGDQSLPFDVTTSLAWDALLHLPASGEASAQDAQGKPVAGLALLVQRDPQQATLQVSLDGAALYPRPGSGSPPEIAAQVFILDPACQLADQSETFRSAAAPPPPAALLLAFDNTFPAYTPAQALRRWDGAHTGPLGGRHGLSNLLRLARNHALPLALLDLRYPARLSALDYAGDPDGVESMADSGLLILPEYLHEPLSVPGLPAYMRNVSRQFDLPASKIGYAQSMPSYTSGEMLLFLPTRSDDSHSAIYRQGERRLLPIPLPAANRPDLQPDIKGLSPASITLLVDTALQAAAQADQPPILVLGGDLTVSSWGNPEVARAAFRYIEAHPWIKPLGAYDLVSLPAAGSPPEIAPYYPPPPAAVASLPWDSMLAQAQEDPLQAAALQAALALSPPAAVRDPRFAALQAIYAAQVHVLLAASHWAHNPQPAATCEIDLDLDGAPECLLASDHLYLVFEPEIGALTHAFYLSADGPHQLIAPSSQFTFGTGDPAEWDLSAGLLADPTVIPGAFYDGAGAYQAQVSPGQLILTDASNAVVKRFSLLPDGLRVEYQANTPLVVRLPLALDPWRRFEPGWGELYKGETSRESWLWGIFPASEPGAGLQVEVTTSGRLQTSAFNATQDRMGRVEDPNTEYPPGHYLPFPISLAEITGRGGFWVEVQVNSK